MKASTVIAVATGLTASLVAAQLEAIPQCALGCAITSLGQTGCQTTDIPCICKATSFITVLTPCVDAACTPAEIAATIKAATELCAQAGVSLSIPSAPAATTTTVASSTSTEVEVSTTTESATSTEATTLTSVYVPPVNTTVTTSAPTPSSNATVTIAPPSTTAIPTPSPTGNAAGRNAVAITGLGAIVAFVAALL